jgi:hypothetical protein
MPIPVAIATSTRPRSRRKVGFAPNCDVNGVVIQLQGSISNGGDVTISATKLGGGSFGPGTYYVKVYDPTDPVVGNHCAAFNVNKGQPIVVANSANVLSFASFPSLLTCGGAEKAYCVTKSAGGDEAFYCSSTQYRVKYN